MCGYTAVHEEGRTSLVVCYSKSICYLQASAAAVGLLAKMDESSYERRDRVLLRPWLENMLENGSIPGLEWFDKDRMMFKVPWKHRSKKDWSLRHSSVFLVCHLLQSVY